MARQSRKRLVHERMEGSGGAGESLHDEAPEEPKASEFFEHSSAREGAKEVGGEESGRQV